MSVLAETMERWFARHGNVPDGSRLLVAVSGGVDSMVLLSLLHDLAGVRKWRLVVAHLNHQLRGRSSDADERFVTTHCQKRGVPCVVARRDVGLFAKRRKISIEMAARDLRHRFLAQTARRRGCRIIALAHHADDQAELVLLRLIRGSGSEGLGGMSVSSPSAMDPAITLWRPLIEVRREAILDFARLNHVRFREDRSNSSTRHLRNRVRHELLPLLREKYQPAIQSVLCRTASILSAEADYISELASEWLANGGRQFDGLPLAVRRRVIQVQSTGLGIMLDFETLERLVAASNLKVNVPGGKHLLRTMDGRIRLVETPDKPPGGKAVTVSLNRSGQKHIDGVIIRWKVEPGRPWKLSDRVASEERFDADRVGQRIVLRHWEPGDRFQPIGMSRSVKLQDLFTNSKVSRSDRIKRVVAEARTGGIFWVQGLRIGEGFKLRPDTRKQLVWRWNCS